MRILYLSKIYTNASWGAETYLNSALQKLGIYTICLDYEIYRYKLSKQIMQISSDFDAVIVQRGTGYLFPVDIIRSFNCPRVLLFTELVERNPHQLKYLTDHLFEHVFLRTESCRQKLIQAQAVYSENTSILLSAYSPTLGNFSTQVKKDIDILFVGNILPRRQDILAKLKLKFGVVACQAYTNDMVKLINRSKIVLNIHAENFLDTETRVFEVLGCGGFLVTETLSDESPFINGVHLVEAPDYESLESKLTYYLNNENERLQIALAGQREVLNQHTYTNRAQQVVSLLNLKIDQAEVNRKPKSRINYETLHRSQLAEKVICTREFIRGKFTRYPTKLNNILRNLRSTCI